MKKSILILSIVCLLSSCASIKEQIATPSPKATPASTVAPSENVVAVTKIKAADESEATGMTSVRKLDYDFFKSGKQDNITLYTSAKKENGEFMWDDSQRWVLEIKTKENKYYTLYSGQISLGNVYFDVSEIDDKLEILIYVHGSSELAVYKCSLKNNTIEKQEIYTHDANMNNIYSSIPSYR